MVKAYIATSEQMMQMNARLKKRTADFVDDFEKSK